MANQTRLVNSNVMQTTSNQPVDEKTTNVIFKALKNACFNFKVHFNGQEDN